MASNSSATHSFTQIKRAADEHGARLVFVHLTPELGKAFRAVHFFTEDVKLVDNLDQGLEDCEDAIIKSVQRDHYEGRSLHEWLSEAMGNSEYADVLARQCVRVEVAAGETIAWS